MQGAGSGCIVRSLAEQLCGAAAAAWDLQPSMFSLMAPFWTFVVLWNILTSHTDTDTVY